MLVEVGSEPGMGELSSNEIRCPGNVHVCPPPYVTPPSTSSRSTRSGSRVSAKSCASPASAKKKSLPKKATATQSPRKVVNKKKMNEKKKEPRKSNPKVDLNQSDVCPVCEKVVGESEEGLECDECLKWRHRECIDISEEEYVNINDTGANWLCYLCSSQVPSVIAAVDSPSTSNKVKGLIWGEMKGTDEIRKSIDSAYESVVKWDYNIMQLPLRGKEKDCVMLEITRLIRLYNENTPWKGLALHMLQIFLPIVLQKPYQKSKNKNNKKYLSKRLEMWKLGRLKELVSECSLIQDKMKKVTAKKTRSQERTFTQLMMHGKVKKALDLVNTSNDVKGVHEVTDQIKENLQSKHPDAAPINSGSTPYIGEAGNEVEEVYFEDIDAESIIKATKMSSGSGGPTKIDMDLWQQLLCTKFSETHSKNLADEIATLTKRLCTQDVCNDEISTLLACRLVPLKKSDGAIRPVGIGEALRRIMGKAVSWVVKKDIVEAVGTLQTCAGMESGIEGAIHAVKRGWDEPGCEAVLLVDADNAFNRINRKVSLENIKSLCPPLHKYLLNCYNTPARLYLKDGTWILSKEGATQGDNLAMAMYSLSTRPLIELLAGVIADQDVFQTWFADDSSALGKLAAIKIWWDTLCKHGPGFGYHPKPAKTILILKDETLMPKALEIFGDTGIKITCDGDRHLGAVIGSETFKDEYVSKKVAGWVEDVKKLSRFAIEDPQAAYIAYTKGMSSRWTFVQRRVCNTSKLFQPLEDVIRQVLLPAIVGRAISDSERNMIALPMRYGGLGIQNPVEIADREYFTSKKITEKLTDHIYAQHLDLTGLDRKWMGSVKSSMKLAKETFLKKVAQDIANALPEKQKNAFLGAQCKGASS